MSDGSAVRGRVGRWLGAMIVAAIAGAALSPAGIAGQDEERWRELQRQLEETQRQLAEMADRLQREWLEAEPQWEEAQRQLAEKAEEWQREWRQAEPQWEEAQRRLAEAAEKWQREWRRTEPQWEEAQRKLAEAAEKWQREWGQAEPRLDELRTRMHRVGLVWTSTAVLGVWLEMELDRDLEELGARVSRIVEGGPADLAGVRAGDVIVSFDGRNLAEPLDEDVEARLDDDRSFPAQRLVALLAEMSPGEPVAMVVERDGENLSLTVTPGEREDAPQWQWRVRTDPPNLTSGFTFSFSPRVGGLDLVELNPGLGAYFGTDEGVLVADVDDDSGLSLRPGDVVVAVDGRLVDDGPELRRILRSYEDGDEIEFSIWRDGAETRVTGTIES